MQNKLVTGIEKTADGFLVTAEDGGQHESKYVILAEGKGVKLAIGLGLTQKGQPVKTCATLTQYLEGQKN